MVHNKQINSPFGSGQAMEILRYSFVVYTTDQFFSKPEISHKTLKIFERDQPANYISEINGFLTMLKDFNLTNALILTVMPRVPPLVQ